MIKEVLIILKDKLNDSDNGLMDDDGEIAIVDDIAKHDEEAATLDNKVVITLLNVQEEASLKNTSWYTRKTISEDPPLYDMKKQNPPAYLNLYVMISANRNAYDKALSNISKTIEIFQTNNVLDYIDADETKISNSELNCILFPSIS